MGKVKNSIVDVVEAVISGLPTYETLSVEDEVGEAEYEPEHDPYPMFGLFRSRSISNVLMDVRPAILILFYSIWVVITKRYLAAMSSIIVFTKTDDMNGVEVTRPSLRWLGDNRLVLFQDEHLWIGILGMLGLVIWSVGFFAFLISRMIVNRNRLNELHVRRLYGFSQMVEIKRDTILFFLAGENSQESAGSGEVTGILKELGDDMSSNLAERPARK